MLPDYYSILQVRPDASPEEVRAAYRRIAKLYHPDAGGTSEAFQSVQEAYDILSDPVLRRKYDAAHEGRFHRLRVEPDVDPEPLIAAEPLHPARSSRLSSQNPLEEFDRLFREFDAFFERLERELFSPFWGRND